jgi:hypothetical protein
MMGGHEQQGSDKGAAFAGLIGGAIFVGGILYGITMWTNSVFAKHGEGEKPKAQVAVEAPAVG